MSAPEVGQWATHARADLDPRQVSAVSEDGLQVKLRIGDVHTPFLPAENYTFSREVTSPAMREAARHVLWHNGDGRGQQPGSFTAKLLNAWANADQGNSHRLASAFPDLGKAVHISQMQGSDALAQWAGIK